ncbi:uncharacterized protein DDB_G0287625-like [Microplitis mediator]|uniref:uncharacterized protein DDB_G0287625-like n=1 Tax=Microplitis mediator TaxID=375433 RepID=UPI002554E306|nr:uncharacterized protein DDB_G0287625-like [Microplitis mediator]
MGNVTSGENNDDLVDILKILGYIKTKNVEQIFRAVDRGDYVLPSHRSEAYKDLSWKIGNIHLSAPCIYSKVMEGLSLEPGLSFLNIGSGTGYLSTMAGLILKHHGTNHGIELNKDCMEYAYEKLEEFKQKSLAIDEFDFCEPVFIHGNCLKVECTRKYDRVYCGAACPESHEAFIKQFVKVGGILVMPYKDHLLRIERVDKDSWKHKVMLPVIFASLVLPTDTNNSSSSNNNNNNNNNNHNNNNNRDHHNNNNSDKVEDDSLCHNTSLILPFSEPLSLQELCRYKIRCQLRENIWAEHPELEKKHPITAGAHKAATNSFSSATQSSLQRCIVPLFEESNDNSYYSTLNDDDDDDDDENDDNNDDDNEDDDDDDDGNNDYDTNGVNNKDRSLRIRRRQNRKTRLFFCLEHHPLDEPNEQEEHDEDEHDDGIEQVTSFRVVKKISPAKNKLNLFKLDSKSIDDKDDNNKSKEQELSGNAFQPSTSQYLSQGCSNNDNSQQEQDSKINSNDIVFTSAKESLDSLTCDSNYKINSNNHLDEEIMQVDKEHEQLSEENSPVVDDSQSVEQKASILTNIKLLEHSSDVDDDDDDDSSMEWLNSIKPRHQQQTNKSGIPDYLNNTESHPSLSKRSKVNNIDNNDNNYGNSQQNCNHHNQPRVCAYIVDIKSLSSHMKTKISQLPLPISLRLFINYNRSL